VSATALPLGDLAIDRELSDIAGSFRFLLDLTPIDGADARARFAADGQPPEFHYREAEDDLEVLEKRLDAVALDDVSDPTLASILRAKARELDLQLEMLAQRGRDAFLGLSLELYGVVSDDLRAEADAILAAVDRPAPDPGPWLDASAFVQAAQEELDGYRAFAPDLESHVELREGTAGVMVSNGDVLVDPKLRVSAARCAALLHHEVGVHVVTHVNGRNQPLHVLSSGLAHHDETQEGLAVLAEHLVGGLSGTRLRQLAARVVAVDEMVKGAGFPEVHADLVDAGIGWESAFTVTMRVFRSGGLTKDAVYLRGLRQLVDHLADGGDLEPLWLGKLPLEAVPLVEALLDRGVLVPPLLRPRFLDDPGAQARLAAVREVRSLTELIGATP
jgi:uncharacterized protein (TIGR02421 family)